MTATILPAGARATSDWESYSGIVTRSFSIDHGAIAIVGLQDLAGRVTEANLFLAGGCLDVIAAEDLAEQLPGIVAELRGLLSVERPSA